MFTRDENTLTGTIGDDDMLFETITVDGDGSIYDKVIVYGLAGNDTINSLGDWYQHLEVYGGDGNDIIKDNEGPDLLSGDGGDDTIYSFSEKFYGGQDTVAGGEGNDTIIIIGAARATGDAGDDTFKLGGRFGYENKANLSGGDGTDTLEISGSLTRVQLDSIEELVVKGSVTLGNKALGSFTHISADHNKQANIYLSDATEVDAARFDPDFHGTVTGSDFDDVLNFSRSGNSIDLVGWKGADVLKGSSASNQLYGGAGNDTIYGGAGDDKISVEQPLISSDSGFGKNLAYGGTGNDEIELGQQGTSTVWGGAGDDVIFRSLAGGRFSDELHGDGGDDLFQLSGKFTNGLKVIGGAGKDTLEFNGEISDGAVVEVDILKSDGVVASAEVLNAFNLITGLQKHIYISLSEGGLFAPRSVQGEASFYGSAEDDVVDLSRTKISGRWRDFNLGRGDDVFIATKFDDKVLGGDGSDTFVFDDHSGKDTIVDFANDRREADILDFSKSKIINSIADFKAHLSEDGHVSFGDTVIDLTTNAKLLNLGEANFIF